MVEEILTFVSAEFAHPGSVSEITIHNSRRHIEGNWDVSVVQLSDLAFRDVMSSFKLTMIVIIDIELLRLQQIVERNSVRRNNISRRNRRNNRFRRKKIKRTFRNFVRRV